jgi:hypothetical protein
MVAGASGAGDQNERARSVDGISPYSSGIGHTVERRRRSASARPPPRRLTPTKASGPDELPVRGSVFAAAVVGVAAAATGAAVVDVVVGVAAAVTATPGGKIFIVSTMLRGVDPEIGSGKALFIVEIAAAGQLAGAVVIAGTTKVVSVMVAVCVVALYLTPPVFALLRCAALGPSGHEVALSSGMSMRVSDEPASVTAPVWVLSVPAKSETGAKWTVVGTGFVNCTGPNVVPDFGKVRFPLPSDVPTMVPVNAIAVGVPAWMRWNVEVSCTVTLPAGSEVDGTVVGVDVLDVVVVVAAAAAVGASSVDTDAATSAAAPTTDIKQRRPRMICPP